MARAWVRRLVGVVGVVLLVVTAFAGGVLFDRAYPAGDLEGISATSVGDAAAETAGIIEAKAYGGSSDASLTIGAINGMLESLEDSHAVYYDARHYKYLLEQTSGTFYGIGVTIASENDKLVVKSVVDRSPAKAAGIVAGDVIVSINGETRKVWSTDDAVLLIRGKAGTVVTLGIQRGAEPQLRTFRVTRAAIEVPNIKSELLEGNVGYICLYTFNEQAADEVRSAMEGLEAKGATGLILDLRDNPGGLLSAAVDVSSLFIKEGVIVRVEGRSGAAQQYQATGGIVTAAPLVVLINGNSASASEITAGALQDYGRARLVGEKSYGKGSVQELEELSFGGAIKLTVAHYVTPKSRVIDGVGLTPDVTVSMSPELAANHATDTQLQQAIQELRAFK